MRPFKIIYFTSLVLSLLTIFACSEDKTQKKSTPVHHEKNNRDLATQKNPDLGINEGDTSTRDLSIATHDAMQHITWLGVEYSDARIQTLKKRLGASRPQMDYEDATAHWYYYKYEGVDFVFADEAIFTDNEIEDIGVGKLFFTGVDFSPNNNFGDSQSLHRLPFGVNYNDSYHDVVTKMKKAGALQHHKESTGEHYWALSRPDGSRYVVAFTFADNDNSINIVKIRLYYGQDYLMWIEKPE